MSRIHRSAQRVGGSPRRAVDDANWRTIATKTAKRRIGRGTSWSVDPARPSLRRGAFVLLLFCFSFATLSTKSFRFSFASLFTCIGKLSEEIPLREVIPLCGQGFRRWPGHPARRALGLWPKACGIFLAGGELQIPRGDGSKTSQRLLKDFSKSA